MAPTQFAKNVLHELRSLVTQGSPVLSSSRGEFFVSPSLPMGTVKLAVPVEEYLAYIENLGEEVRPSRTALSLVEGEPFHVIVSGVIEVGDNALTIDGRKVMIL